MQSGAYLCADAILHTEGAWVGLPARQVREDIIVAGILGFCERCKEICLCDVEACRSFVDGDGEVQRYLLLGLGTSWVSPNVKGLATAASESIELPPAWTPGFLAGTS